MDQNGAGMYPWIEETGKIGKIECKFGEKKKSRTDINLIEEMTLRVVDVLEDEKLRNKDTI